MSPKLRNCFLLIGIIAIVVMLFGFDLSYAEIWEQLQHSGWWFVAVVGIWLPIYMLNALAWRVIINDGQQQPLGYWRTLKYTITGFIMNYITPMGLLGGEPYRIMELKPYVGVAKATSSVLLYAMMHIFSHFLFWAFSIPLYLLLHFSSVTPALALMLAAGGGFCGLGIYVFMKGYRNGFTTRALRWLTHVPFIRQWATRLVTEQAEELARIDAQIAELHATRRSTFYVSVGLEFTARIVGCVEIWCIMQMLPDGAHIGLLDCILIQSFTSLFANLFFFMPLGLGAREGGFALAVGGLSIASGFGVLAALVTRIRELIWICIGLVLMKLWNTPSDAPKKR